jgi:hypothetical protein
MEVKPFPRLTPGEAKLYVKKNVYSTLYWYSTLYDVEVPSGDRTVMYSTMPAYE